MGRRRVLVIVEGAKQEVRLMKRMFEVYGLDLDYEIYSYETNIHELYERMFLGTDSPGELSLMGVLKERARPSERHMFDEDYSDVLLVFDYDPQDDRFSPERLEEMLTYFDESTDEGKLYINYPMVEACKDFESSGDAGYLDRKVSESELGEYKNAVSHRSPFQNYQRDFDKDVLDGFISLVATKACRVTEPDLEVLSSEESFRRVDHVDVLHAQNEALGRKGEIWVLGTCLLAIPDYSPQLVSWSDSGE